MGSDEINMLDTGNCLDVGADSSGGLARRRAPQIEADQGNPLGTGSEHQGASGKRIK